MSVYLYKAGRADGTTFEGSMEGVNEQTVRAHLEAQGCFVFRLRSRGSWPAVPGFKLRMRHSISRQEFLVFNQEFMALVKAGLPILRAWDLLIERTRRPVFLSALQAIRQDIRNGVSLSGALAQHPQLFPELYVATIKAGEYSGNLSEVLHRYIGYLKLMIGLKQKITKAMAYPAFLVLTGIGVVGFLLIYVLPTFSTIYGDAKNLPAPTLALMSAVNILQAHLVSLGFAVVGMILAVRLWLRTNAGREVWDRVALRLPLLGDLLVKHHTIQFTRTLATIFAGGIPLLEALRIIAEGESNRFLAAGLTDTIEQVRGGVRLAAALQHTGILPHMAVEMIAVGEETGSLDMMLRDIAEFHENELDQRLSQLTTWIEPALLLIMGVIVGGIVIVMYLPIFEMAGAVQ